MAIRPPIKSTKFAIAALSMLTTALACEAAFRLLGTKPWYLVDEAPTPQSGTGQARLRYWTNLSPPHLFGRYDRNFGPKEPGVYRILLLGDSFTAGSIGEGDHIAAALLKRRLNREKVGEKWKRFEMLNSAVPGTRTGHWVQILNKEIKDFQPDLVVAVYFLRDGTLMGSIPQIFQRIRKDMISTLNRPKYLRHTALGLHFYARFKLKSVSRKYIASFRSSYFGEGSQTNEWKWAQENILKIRDTTVGSGAQFAFVIFPVLIELHSHYPMKDICDLVESFCRQNKITTLSLLPAFMNQRAEDLWISPLDQHPNKRGHAIAADALYPFFLKRIDETESAQSF